jgi:hypothetical protein
VCQSRLFFVLTSLINSFRLPGGAISSKALHGPFAGNKFTLSSLQKPTIVSGRVRAADGSWV